MDKTSFKKLLRVVLGDESALTPKRINELSMNSHDVAEFRSKEQDMAIEAALRFAEVLDELNIYDHFKISVFHGDDEAETIGKDLPMLFKDLLENAKECFGK